MRILGNLASCRLRGSRLAMCAAAVSALVAIPPQGQAAEEGARCETGGSCLVTLRADLDADGRTDRVELVHEPQLRVYSVIVNTAAGRFYRPFAASHDPAKDKVTLSLRSGGGGGDLRCRAWPAGGDCGYALRSHDVPATVLYLSDSRHGDFVLYLAISTSPTPAGGTPPAPQGSFVVMPALDR